MITLASQSEFTVGQLFEVLTDEKIPVEHTQFIVGIVLCVIAALLFVFVKTKYSAAGVITILILGLAAIAT